MQQRILGCVRVRDVDFEIDDQRFFIEQRTGNIPPGGEELREPRRRESRGRCPRDVSRGGQLRNEHASGPVLPRHTTVLRDSLPDVDVGVVLSRARDRDAHARTLA
jgi:hypothetical protein